MVSSRITGTNEIIETFGGVSRDYTTLNGWEAATDIDLVTTEQTRVLECHADSPSFTDSLLMRGATTNSSYFRILRSASDSFHDGVPTNGIVFTNTANLTLIDIDEDFSSVQDISGTLSINSANVRNIFRTQEDHNSFIGCIAYDGANSGAGSIRGFYDNATADDSFFINCIAFNNDERGFFSSNAFYYNCISINNSSHGFSRTGSNDVKAVNCNADGNSVDFSGTFAASSSNNASGDTTAPGADSRISQSPVHIDLSDDNINLSRNDNSGRRFGFDLSSDTDFPFDDDIRKVTRAAWDISPNYIDLSSRQNGFNENVQTFGDGTRDFTSLSTYEATVDVDTTSAGTATSEVLEMYDDSSPYDQVVLIDGGTHSPTYPLILRAASGHENKGTRDSGVRFDNTATDEVFDIRDDSVYLYDIGIRSSINSGANLAVVQLFPADDCILCGLHIYDSSNISAGISGILLAGTMTNTRIINCIIVETDFIGINIGASATTSIMYNNTVVDHDLVSIQSNVIDSIAKNTIGADGSSSDFGGSYSLTSDTNSSSDATAPGQNPKTNQTFTFASATDYHLGAGDTGAKDCGLDLSTDSFYAFNDDIDGNTRPSSPGIWDIGGAEFIGPTTLAGLLLLLKVGS